ncbi:MAG: rhomboid family intramembrane serine protease [Simkaniaceae bacterium]|nr:rhomboid family intramembrane serine protease [Simkaniaceae bacterium]
MRLIGTVQGKQAATKFSFFLKQEEIENTFNLVSESEDLYEFWIDHEDQIDTATHWLKEFQKNPNDSRFETKAHPIDTEGVAKESYEKEPIQVRAIRMRNKVVPKIPITRFILLLCIVLFIWNGYQMSAIAKEDQDPKQYTLTPLMIDLSYDIPDAKNRTELSNDLFSEDKIGNPTVWDGIYGVLLKWPASKDELKAPMFEKIREGQIWRLFTPVLLHGGFLHILFNMLWLWMLGRQVEERTRKWQYILITLIIGVVSNTLQYLMSGPLFIGYSGIVCGLAGFIWMRQRLAPWEGYPLQKGTLVFLGVFIVAMMGIQFASFIFMRFQLAEFSMNIANTAHISGALFGMLLGRIPFFSKGSI